jgi:hypothetical protein
MQMHNMTQLFLLMVTKPGITQEILDCRNIRTNDLINSALSQRPLFCHFLGA